MQKKSLETLQSDILEKMLDKKGNFLSAVKHITGSNEDAWCKEKMLLGKGFRFEKKTLPKDKIAEFKRKRDLK
jgi:hypothetical protein